MCHNALTDPAGWSRSIKHRESDDALPNTASEGNGKVKKRGTNWDGTHGEDKRDYRENTIDRDLQARGTSWDNSPSRDDARLQQPGEHIEDKSLETAQKRELQDPYGTGFTQSRTRGIIWDNLSGDDERNPLDPKVGQGGTPQALNSNGWGRLTRSLHTTLATRADGKTTNGDIERAVESKRNVAPNGGKPTPIRPAGGCINCLVRKWVAAPFASSFYPSGSRIPITGAEPKPDSNKMRLRRTEDSKGSSAGADSDKPDGGVPMPLCGICWYRRVKRCFNWTKESGWRCMST
ncbi:MAG: hypothetical protein Q9213_003780 [Squamulea squamosa]